VCCKKKKETRNNSNFITQKYFPDLLQLGGINFLLAVECSLPIPTTIIGMDVSHGIFKNAFFSHK